MTCAAATLKIPRAQVLQGAGVTLLGGQESQSGAGHRLGRSGARRPTRSPGCWPRSIESRRGWPPTCRWRRRRPCRPRSARCGASWRKTWSRTRPPGSAASGAASPPSACRRWATRRCAMGARRGRSLFTGYKRHVIKVVDADLIVGAVVRPANEPEHHALALVEPDVVQHGPLAEVQMDRGYWGARAIGALHAQGVAIRAKAWTSTNGGRFPKQAFTIDLAAAARVVCPAQQRRPDPVGATAVHFPAAVCQACALRAGMHDRDARRAVHRHPCAGSLLQTLTRPPTRSPRAAHTSVTGPPSSTHSPASIRSKARRRATKGTRKNTLDLRRDRRHRQPPAPRPAPEGCVTLRVRLSRN